MPIAAKPERPLAEVIQRNATVLGMSYGDYLVHLAAQALDMPEYAPKPTRTGDTLEALTPDDSPILVPATPVAFPALTTAEELRHKIAS